MTSDISVVNLYVFKIWSFTCIGQMTLIMAAKLSQTVYSSWVKINILIMLVPFRLWLCISTKKYNQLEQNQLSSMLVHGLFISVAVMYICENINNAHTDWTHGAGWVDMVVYLKQVKNHDNLMDTIKPGFQQWWVSPCELTDAIGKIVS